MNSLPTTLDDEDAGEITKLLQDARKCLRDAMGMREHQGYYVDVSTRIAELLQRFEIEAG